MCSFWKYSDSVKTLILLCVFMFVANDAPSVWAQTNVWEAISGGTREDRAWAVETMQNSSTATIGYSISEGPNILSGFAHPMVNILDRKGLNQSVRQYNFESDRQHYDIIQLSSGDLVWVATVRGSGGDGWNILVARVTQQLGTVWMRQIATAHDEYVASVIECSNGNLAIAGFVNNGSPTDDYEVFAARLNATNGVTIWSNIYGTGQGSQERAVCIRELSTGDFILAGRAERAGLAGQEDALLLKVNAAGLATIAGYYGPVNSQDSWRDLEIDANDNIFACGESCPTSPPTSRIMLAEINSATLVPITPLNMHYPTGHANTHAGGWGIEPSHTPGNYVITGYIERTATTPKDIFLMEVGAALGPDLWATYYGKTGDDHGYDVAKFESPHPDIPGSIEKGYHVAGSIDWNTSLGLEWYNSRVGVNGLTSCDKALDLAIFYLSRDLVVNFGTTEWEITRNKSTNFTVIFSTFPFCEGEDPQVFNKGSEPAILIETDALNNTATSFAVKQGDYLTATLVGLPEGAQSYGVYDMQGRKLMDGSFNVASDESIFELKTAGFSPGLYLIRLSSGANIQMLVTP